MNQAKVKADEREREREREREKESGNIPQEGAGSAWWLTHKQALTYYESQEMSCSLQPAFLFPKN